MLLTPAFLIRALWLGLAGVWLVGAVVAKPIARRQSTATRLVQTVLMVTAYELLFPRTLELGWLGWRFVKPSTAETYAGLAVTAAGVAFTLWARFILGGNWSGSVTVKHNHELVQRGPYAIVRHPIYSGITLALLGTALAVGEVRGLVAVAVGVLAWRLKWPIEERFMTEQFGHRYVEYKQRVSALIPGIW